MIGTICASDHTTRSDHLCIRITAGLQHKTQPEQSVTQSYSISRQTHTYIIHTSYIHHTYIIHTALADKLSQQGSGLDLLVLQLQPTVTLFIACY